jgi:hypothetical protein
VPGEIEFTPHFGSEIKNLARLRRTNKPPRAMKIGGKRVAGIGLRIAIFQGELLSGVYATRLRLSPVAKKVFHMEHTVIIIMTEFVTHDVKRFIAEH